MKSIKLLDVVIGILAASLIIFSFVRIYSQGGSASQVIIKVDETVWTYALDTDRELAIPGPLGDTIVHIENGSVHVEDSPCTNKYCVAAGNIDRPGEWIVCLPNHVFISIDGTVAEDTLEVDDVVF